MSKRGLSLALLLVLGISLLILTGCFTKEPKTPEQFREIMEDNGFVVSDLTDQYEEGLVKSVLVAMDVKNDFQIEYFEQDSDADAIVSFNMNVSTMEDNKGQIYKTSDFRGQNYENLSMTTNGEYWVVSRIENTVIFAHVSEEHKEVVESMLERLNY